MTSTAASRIRELNDAFRKGPMVSDWMLTPGVAGKGLVFTSQAVNAVRSHDRFTADNDPYGEHDFGSFSIGAEKLFWKIDYYDQTLEAGSEDPSDPAKTQRVMTIMLASEY